MELGVEASGLIGCGGGKIFMKYYFYQEEEKRKFCILILYVHICTYMTTYNKRTVYRNCGTCLMCNTFCLNFFKQPHYVQMCEYVVNHTLLYISNFFNEKTNIYSGLGKANTGSNLKGNGYLRWPSPSFHYAGNYFYVSNSIWKLSLCLAL